MDALRRGRDITRKMSAMQSHFYKSQILKRQKLSEVTPMGSTLWGPFIIQ